jgi:hemerythrin-like domain-containing protein
MEATRFLKQEHETAKGAFKKIEDAAPQQRGQLWKQLEPELKVHEQIEEAHFYGPLSQDARDPELRDWNRRHHQEVEQAEAMIKAIGRLDPPDDAWLAKVKELKQALEHHIQEEEQQIFPKAREAWDQSRLEQAGRELEKGKAEGLRKAA